MAMKLLPLAAATLLMPGAALVTEVVKPGKKRQAHVTVAAESAASNSSSTRNGGGAFAPAIACGMTTPIVGTSPGSYNQMLNGKSLQECLDACVASATCLAVISRNADAAVNPEVCFLVGRQYDALHENNQEGYVANKLTGANCDSSYDYLFDGCPRGQNGGTVLRSSSMKIWECQQECDSHADCLAFEANGCLGDSNCGTQCYTFHGDNPQDIYNGNCVTSGDQKSYLKVALNTEAPTAAPTSSPTSSPTTAAPTAAPTSSPTYLAAGLIGDPHVTNLLGKRFDLHYVGNLMLLQVPRGAGANATLLRLDGHTKRVGGLCDKELYLDQVHFSGKWVLARNGAALTVAARRTSADPSNKRHKQHFQLGGVYVVLSHAQTDTGTTYMNLRVTNLSQLGMPIGGLLGEDDFSWAYAMPAACQAQDVGKDGGHGGSVGSFLVASAL